MKPWVDNLQNDLEQEKTSRNKDAQYQRYAVNLKILGLPLQGEEGNSDTSKMRQKSTSANNRKTLDFISRLVDAAGITNFNTEQIDVCHRLGSNHFSPIIARFSKKTGQKIIFPTKT